MLTRTLQWLSRHPWPVLVLLSLSVVPALLIARAGLFDAQGVLRIDTSLERYIARDSDAYAFFRETEARFGSDEVVLFLVSPPERAPADLDFLLALEAFTRRLQVDVPGAGAPGSVFTAPRVDGACAGKSYFHQEAAGSYCRSVLERYRAAVACNAGGVTTTPVGPASAGSADGKAPPGDRDSVGLDEAPLLFDAVPGHARPGDAGPPKAGTADPDAEPGGKAAIVCTPDLLATSVDGWRVLTLRAASQALYALSRDPLLVGELVSRDGRDFGIALPFPTGSNPNSEPVQAALGRLAEEMRASGYPTAYYGQSRQHYEATRTMRADMRTILPISLVIMAVVLALAFRSVRGVLVPLGVVLVGSLWTAAVFAAVGSVLTPVTLVLPPLLVCVGTAYVIYFMNQYYLAAGTGATGVAVVERTLAEVTVPLVVTALTTIAGFAALIASPIPAIKVLGVYACFGVAAIIVLTLTLVPAVLTVLPPSRPLQSREDGYTGPERILDRGLRILSGWIGTYSLRFIVFWIAVGLLAMGGVAQIRIDSAATLFDKDHPLMRDLAQVERQLGGLHFLRVVFERSEPVEGTAATRVETAQFETAEAMIRLAQLEARLSDPHSVYGALEGISVDRVYSPVPYLRAVYGEETRWTDSGVRQLLATLSSNDGPRFVGKDGRHMQITLRLRTAGTSALLELSTLLRQELEAWPPGVRVRLTGSEVLASESANNIARSQIWSVALALVIIFVILSLLFLSPKMGLLALCPNLVSIAAFFGVLGWVGIPLGFTISIIAAIALGIGVDDTIHYLAHYNTNVKIMRNERAAAQATLQQVGRPMVTTTIALASGFLIFMASGMETQELFGGLLAFTLLICLITDLNFLPSIMARTKLITAWDYLTLDYPPERLRQISLFRGMSHRETKLTSLMAYPLDCAAGEAVFAEGDRGRELFVVLDGAVEVFHTGPNDGHERVLARLGIGAAFGEMGLFRHAVRAASVRAVEQTQLLVITEQVLVRLQRRYPRIAAQVFLNLAGNLAQAIQRVDRSFMDRLSGASPSQAFLQMAQPSAEDLRAAVREIVADGVITAIERRALEDKVYADGRVSPEERALLDDIEARIRDGRLIENAPVYAGMLHGLSSRQAAWLTRSFVQREVPRGDAVWRQGAEGNSMFLILAGKLNLQRSNSGESVGMRTVYEGELVGEEFLLAPGIPSEEIAVVLEDTRLLCIDRTQLEWVRSRRPRLAAQFAYNIVCMLSDRLQQANVKLYAD